MSGIEFCARTDTGRVRANNEDALAFDAALQVALLADGMGGYNAGEVASSMAVSHLLDALKRELAQAGAAPDAGRIHLLLERGLFEANAAVYQAARADPACRGMGTTLVAAVFFAPRRLLVAHLGDSRCYRLRDGALELLTHDHSALQEQLDMGLLTPAQAVFASDLRNLVTRALGVEPSALPEIREHAVQPGDLYLLCSDGLNDMLDDARIARIARGAAPLAHKAQALIDAANAQGGRDNVSVLLAQIARDAAAARERPRGTSEQQQ